jgi:hypothetical protein
MQRFLGFPPLPRSPFALASLPSLRLPRSFRLLPLLAFSVVLVGCATLHRAQLDEIDAQHGFLRPFEIHVSETGVDVKAIGTIASIATRSSRPSQIANLVALFEFGPKTGEVVFDDKFADNVAEEILERCPSARVTGLMSVRESTNYYAVSGEFVTVRGFCIVD